MSDEINLDQKTPEDYDKVIETIKERGRDRIRARSNDSDTQAILTSLNFNSVILTAILRVLNEMWRLQRQQRAEDNV